MGDGAEEVEHVLERGRIILVRKLETAFSIGRTRTGNVHQQGRRLLRGRSSYDRQEEGHLGRGIVRQIPGE